MPVISREDLVNAAADALTLDQVVNGGALDDVVTRTGRHLRTLASLGDQGSDVHVFVAMGQSIASLLSSGNSALAPVPVTGKAIEYAGGALRNVVEPVYPHTSGYGSFTAQFCVDYYEATGIVPCVVQAAVGQSSLLSGNDTGGAGDWSSTGSLFGDMVSAVTSAIAALVADGKNPILMGGFLDLGQSEAIAIETGSNGMVLDGGGNSAQVTAGFTDLLTRWFAQFPNVPMHINRIGIISGASSGSPPYTRAVACEAVSRSQEFVAATVKHVYISNRNAINYIDQGYQTDPTHPGQKALNMMGTKFAQSVIARGLQNYWQRVIDTYNVRDIFYNEGFVRIMLNDGGTETAFQVGGCGSFLGGEENPIDGTPGSEIRLGYNEADGVAFIQGILQGTAIKHIRLQGIGGSVGVGRIPDDTKKLDVGGAIQCAPGSSQVPVSNGDVTFQLSSNTLLTFKARGSDGTVRAASLTLS